MAINTIAVSAIDIQAMWRPAAQRSRQDHGRRWLWCDDRRIVDGGVPSCDWIGSGCGLCRWGCAQQHEDLLIFLGRAGSDAIVGRVPRRLAHRRDQ